MNRPIRSSQLPEPTAAYELGMYVPAGREMVFTAGIIGFRADGTLPDTLADQAAQVWANIGEILSSAGFVPSDVVSYTTYVTSGGDLDVVMAARDAFFGGHGAASTLITVPALVRPEWLVETSAVAAR